LFLGLFLSTLDTSIVATSLVTILTDFNDFAKSPWIVLAYLVTYMSASTLPDQAPPNEFAGFAVAFARLSDVYGRKTMVMTAWVIFTAFSVGCGFAQSMVQL
jgi:MFS family permease